jgi:methionyl-tRNA formyltransferase
MVSQLLETLDENPARLPQTSQDLTQRQCFGRQVPHRGRVIWSLPAQHVVNFVRACDFYPFLSPWGHPQTHRGNLEIQIVKARRTRVHANAPAGTVGYLNVGGPVVACADEWIYVDKVKVQDRFLDTTEVLRIRDHLEDGGWN